MTILRWFTDPHVGKELKANTTPASRATLSEQVFLHGKAAAEMPHPGGREVHYTICGGDLFDTDTNPEHVLLAGSEIARKCNLVLGGNHDVINITGRESSLSALAKLTEDERFVMPPGPGKVKFEARRLGGVLLMVVPHHARQQEFEEAMQAAERAANSGGVTETRKILLVHCNYHLTFEAGENDLNLTDAVARKLLQTFDYIVMGHDHRPRRECNGRLIVLGNTHPTSFSDLGEKFVWFYDSETNEFTQELLCTDNSRVIQAAELIENWKAETLHVYQDIEWIDLVGVLPPEAAVDLAKSIRALWKGNNFLYAVRASKVLFQADGLAQGVDRPAQQRTLMEVIEEDLGKSPELLELFREAKELKEA